MTEKWTFAGSDIAKNPSLSYYEQFKNCINFTKSLTFCQKALHSGKKFDSKLEFYLSL